MKKITVLVLITLFLSSCAGVGYIAGGKSTTFEGNYELSSKGSVEKSKSKLKEVLFADGWNKSSETDNVILFENGSSTGSGVAIGKVQKVTMKAEFSNEKVKLQITQYGNFKFGTEKATNETFEKIKKQYNL